MGPQWIWLPLLLIIYTEHVKGNHKKHDTSLKPVNDESVFGKTVISVDPSTHFPDSLCKCKVHGRWEEKNLCFCAKHARRKNRRVNWRKLCQGTNRKHKCRFFKERQRNLPPIVPI